MASRQLRVFIVGDADSAAAAAAATEKRFGKMGSKLGSIGDKVNKAFRGAAIGTAGAVVGILGTAVKTGWDRLSSLEQSHKMFDQMGLSAEETEKVMARLDQTVTGTAFSLDDGAAAMAGLISSGVGLEDVGRHMDLIADAAAFGQAPLGEIADIFRRIETNGKLSARELRMLTDRNIPAFQVLAAGIGTTADEIGLMVTRGEIDAKTFVSAWEKGAKGFGDQNIKIEGAAKSMGDTVKGAFGNAKTALARFGAVIIGPVFRAMPKILEVVTGGLNDLKDAAQNGMDALATQVGRFDFSRVVNVMSKAIPIFKDVGSILLDVGKIIGDGLPIAFGAFVTGLDLALTALQPFVSLLSSVTGWLADHSTMVLVAAGAWAAWTYVVPLLGGLKTAISGVIDGFTHFASSIDGIARTKGVSKFKATTEAFGGVLGNLSKVAIPAAVLAIGALAQSWKSSGEKAKAASREMWDSAEQTMEGMGKLVEDFRRQNEAAANNLSSDSFWGNAWDGLGMVVQGVGSAVGIMDDKIAQNARILEQSGGDIELAAQKYTDLEQAFTKVAAAWDGADMSLDRDFSPTYFEEGARSAEKFAQSLGLTVDEVIRLDKEGKLEETLTAARDAAVNGTPAIDKMADAIETLSDETADSTERLKAWKDAINAALGGQKNVTDSTISYRDQMAKLEEQMKENSSSFDINTSAGRQNLSAVSDLIDRTIDLAGAIGEETGSTQDAHAALIKHREEIIDGLSSVMSRTDAEALLAEHFGFTADNLNDVARKATEARTGIENLPSHKTIQIDAYWNEIKSIYTRTMGEIHASTGLSTGQLFGMHTGGTFRAPRPGGEGLVLLRDGERVLTPDQQGPPSTGRGQIINQTTHVTVHVEGSVLTEEELTDQIVDGINRRQAQSPFPVITGVR